MRSPGRMPARSAGEPGVTPATKAGVVGYPIAPKIAMKARSRGCSGVEYTATNWENLNNSDDFWAPGGTRNLGLTTCDVVFYWWEDDGGAADFTLGYGGFSLGVKMDNSDDLFGGKQVPHSTFRGGGSDDMERQGWDGLEQWTE